MDLRLRCWVYFPPLFDNKKGSKPSKTCNFNIFPLIYFANAQLTQFLTAILIVPVVLTYTWGVGTTTLHPDSLFDNKKGSKQRKRCIFISIPLIFLLTLSKFKFRLPNWLYQPCRPTPEVLRLLPSTLLDCLLTKRAQNQEKRKKRVILLVFRSFFLLTLS